MKYIMVSVHQNKNPKNYPKSNKGQQVLTIFSPNFLKSKIILKVKEKEWNKPKIGKNSKIKDKNKMRSPIFVKWPLDPSVIFPEF